MIKQFFTLAIRNILKDKLFSFINFTNLIIGFATFILVALIINEEFSWDKKNENYDRIYRLQLFMDQPENTTQHTSSVTAALSRHELLNQPEIEKGAFFCHLINRNSSLFDLAIFRIRQSLISSPLNLLRVIFKTHLRSPIRLFCPKQWPISSSPPKRHLGN